MQNRKVTSHAFERSLVTNRQPVTLFIRHTFKSRKTLLHNDTLIGYITIYNVHLYDKK